VEFGSDLVSHPDNNLNGAAASPADTVVTIETALRDTRSRGIDMLDAQLLLLHALGRSGDLRAWLKAHSTDALSQPAHEAYQQLLQRRISGEPVAYIIGTREFYGLKLEVDRRVLVPRPETEILVDWALELLATARSALVLDLGTGSGAIALALKSQRPDLDVLAIDASCEALSVAQGNARRLGLDIQFRQGSWLDPVAGKFDLIVANPPYISYDDPHLGNLTAEPRAALVAGPDGMVDLNHIISRSSAYLQAGACLMVEHGYDQAEAVRVKFQSEGYEHIRTRRDLAGIERCTAGWHKA
jgi:release factor glutamine methyltransferase